MSQRYTGNTQCKLSADIQSQLMSHGLVLVLVLLLNFDGTVSQVNAEVGRRVLSLSVDGSRPDSVSIKGNQLDVESTVYLGGLPTSHTARRINVRHLRSSSTNGGVWVP